MAELRLRGGCLDLERAGFTFAHCSSCHEDVDSGYSLGEVALPSGEYLAVCCWVASHLGAVDAAGVLAALDAVDHRSQECS